MGYGMDDDFVNQMYVLALTLASLSVNDPFLWLTH